ncbi:WYL domain-containing protein [uncultured Pseudodesulfovibrio sp.]|uniref:WYL domain-containing protein n=1 Tax=uncultured Pseudodesulfovibrio sp. TaxID=2035858 RepID=UPI0029C92FB6|nr:WYL domain-containing protein [uncultured Pseudodesulfovibrio sp.]
MKKSQLERLLFLEKKLFWFGKVKRKEIQEQFEVSSRVTTNDFSKYHELAPGNAVWDRPSYGYIADDAFKPVLYEPDSAEILGEIYAPTGAFSGSVGVTVLNVPGRIIPVNILRSLLAAIHSKRAIEICYRSMSRAEPTWRRITPHSLAHDGFRWHVRAFCSKRGKFIDLVLGRIVETGELSAPDATSETDTEWIETVKIKIGPDSRLDENQRSTIEMDYGMIDGEASFIVRKSMLFYALKQLCLHRDTGSSPKEQQIVLLNTDILKLL